MGKLALGLVFSAIALSFLATSTFAQTATSSTTKKERAVQRTENVKDKVASREAALKEKLAKFRDKKKAEATERIDNNLNKVNQKRMEMMLQHLDKMSSMLTRLENIVSRATTDGKDTSQATAAISSARSAVNSAKVTIQTQSQKQYNLTVTSEGKVKDDAKSARDNLRTDLQSAHNLVVTARQAVASAISTTKSTLGGSTNGK